MEGKKLGMAGSEREDARRERASSLKGARKGVKVAWEHRVGGRQVTVTGLFGKHKLMGRAGEGDVGVQGASGWSERLKPKGPHTAVENWGENF